MAGEVGLVIRHRVRDHVGLVQQWVWSNNGVGLFKLTQVLLKKQIRLQVKLDRAFEGLVGC